MTRAELDNASKFDGVIFHRNVLTPWHTPHSRDL